MSDFLIAGDFCTTISGLILCSTLIALLVPFGFFWVGAAHQFLKLGIIIDDARCKVLDDRVFLGHLIPVKSEDSMTPLLKSTEWGLSPLVYFIISIFTVPMVISLVFVYKNNVQYKIKTDILRFVVLFLAVLIKSFLLKEYAFIWNGPYFTSGIVQHNLFLLISLFILLASVKLKSQSMFFLTKHTLLFFITVSPCFGWGFFTCMWSLYFLAPLTGGFIQDKNFWTDLLFLFLIFLILYKGVVFFYTSGHFNGGVVIKGIFSFFNLLAWGFYVKLSEPLV